MPDRTLLRAIASIVCLLLPLRLLAQEIYVVAGDLKISSDLGLHYAAPNPLAPLSILSRLKVSYYGDYRSIQYYAGNAFASIGEDTQQFGYPNVEEVYERLRSKGYRIHFVSKLEARDLIQLVKADDTTAVFYSGHSYIAEGHTPTDDNVWLSVYHRRRSVPLTPELLEQLTRASTEDGKEFKAGQNLQLFYASACYGDWCEKTLRQGLRLGPTVQHVNSSGKATVPASRSALPFKNVLKNWAESLPEAPNPESRNRRRLLRWLQRCLPVGLFSRS